MIRWTGFAPWEFEFPFPGALHLPSHQVHYVPTIASADVPDPDPVAAGPSKESALGRSARVAMRHQTQAFGFTSNPKSEPLNPNTKSETPTPKPQTRTPLQETPLNHKPQIPNPKF